MRNGSQEDVRRVSGEIAALRQDMGSLIGELDRRRHELTDIRLQMRRHPVAVVVAAGAAALLLGGMLTLLMREHRQRSRPSSRVRETRRALARLLDHPYRVAAEPSMVAKIGVAAGTAAGVAAGTAAARHLVRLAMARTAPVRRQSA